MLYVAAFNDSNGIPVVELYGDVELLVHAFGEPVREVARQAKADPSQRYEFRPRIGDPLPLYITYQSPITR